jgi:hypothetical protein
LLPYIGMLLPYCISSSPEPVVNNCHQLPRKRCTMKEKEMSEGG